MVKCSTLDELVCEARVLFEVAKESQVFVQRFDDIWMEKVDIDSLDEVHDRDKLFLVCKELNSNTMEKVWHSYKPCLLVYMS